MISQDLARKLHKKYWQDGRSLRSVASEAGMSHETLRAVFKRDGLKIRTRKESWEPRKRD